MPEGEPRGEDASKFTAPDERPVERGTEQEERIRRENEPARSQLLSIIELKPNNRYAHIYDIEEDRELNARGNPLVIRRNHLVPNTPGLAPWKEPKDSQSEYQYDENGQLQLERHFTRIGVIEEMVRPPKDSMHTMILRTEGRVELDPSSDGSIVRYYKGDGSPTGRFEKRSADGLRRELYEKGKLVRRVTVKPSEDGVSATRTTVGGDGKVVSIEEITREEGKTTIVRKDAKGRERGKTIEEMRRDDDLIALRAERESMQGREVRDGVRRPKQESDFHRDERGDPTRDKGWFGSDLGF